MNELSISHFVALCTQSRRITFADVKRLRRSVLQHGLKSRDEIELLLGLDAQVAKADASWAEWLVPAVVDFAVWAERPSGSVAGEPAAWLAGVLERLGSRTRAGRLIAKRIAEEITQEAAVVSEMIVAIAEAEVPPEAAPAPASDATVPLAA